MAKKPKPPKKQKQPRQKQKQKQRQSVVVSIDNSDRRKMAPRAPPKPKPPPPPPTVITQPIYVPQYPPPPPATPAYGQPFRAEPERPQPFAREVPANPTTFVDAARNIIQLETLESTSNLSVVPSNTPPPPSTPLDPNRRAVVLAPRSEPPSSLVVAKRAAEMFNTPSMPPSVSTRLQLTDGSEVSPSPLDTMIANIASGAATPQLVPKAASGGRPIYAETTTGRVRIPPESARRCQAIVAKTGLPCGFKALSGQQFCGNHIKAKSVLLADDA